MSQQLDMEYVGYVATRNETREASQKIARMMHSMEEVVELAMENASFVACARATSVDEAVAALEVVTKQTEAVEAAGRLLQLLMHVANKNERAAMEIARKAVGSCVEVATHKKAYAEGQKGWRDV